MNSLGENDKISFVSGTNILLNKLLRVYVYFDDNNQIVWSKHVQKI